MDYNYSPPPPHPLPSPSNFDLNQQILLDQSFEPLLRARSNTWPCRPTECDPTPPVSCANSNNNGATVGGVEEGGGLGGLGLLQKKSTSRRNAWGNLSYADLITQAISSSPEKRLTLSQIYDWMVTNVTYFKDKGDSNSSAGWKNSIRHNLSLHNRFVRVQNEGTGKSSWWMLNPDAKPGKAARRRATSMETSKYEKKRGRIRKKIEAMRNGAVSVVDGSPCSSLSEGLDIFPEEILNNQAQQLTPPNNPITTFSLSPSEFRPRASSNASSLGRCSPPTLLNDHSQQGLMQGSQWDYSYNTCYSSRTADQLAGNLNLVKIQDQQFYFDEFTPSNVVQPPPYNNTPTHPMFPEVIKTEPDFDFNTLSQFCDVDEVLQADLLQHNLNIEAGLSSTTPSSSSDFFMQQQQAIDVGGAGQAPTTTPTTSTQYNQSSISRHWVH